MPEVFLFKLSDLWLAIAGSWVIQTLARTKLLPSREGGMLKGSRPRWFNTNERGRGTDIGYWRLEYFSSSRWIFGRSIGRMRQELICNVVVGWPVWREAGRLTVACAQFHCYDAAISIVVVVDAYVMHTPGAVQYAKHTSTK